MLKEDQKFSLNQKHTRIKILKNLYTETNKLCRRFIFT